MSQAIESLLEKENLSGGIAIVPYNDALSYLNDPNQIEIFPSENSKIQFFYGARVKFTCLFKHLSKLNLNFSFFKE